jgi:hypothetical protein
VLVVYAKEDPATRQFRNLVRYEQPPRDAGKAVLLDGRSLWFYDPASKASVRRISPQQRLLGQASIADVLTVNLVVEYEATLLGTDEIQDANRHPCKCWHLDLIAVTDRASYSHVELWVEPGRTIRFAAGSARTEESDEAERRTQVIHVMLSQRETGGTRQYGGRRQPSSDSTSRMNREIHVRICKRLEEQLLGPTWPRRSGSRGNWMNPLHDGRRQLSWVARAG